MYRFVAMLISFGVSGGAAWYVYVNLNEIVDRWLVTLGVSSGVFLVVGSLLYFPLLRHIADLIEEQLSTLGARVSARKTGLGFDEVPRNTYQQGRTTTSANRVLCSICGAPGGPVCEKCQDKMAHR